MTTFAPRLFRDRDHRQRVALRHQVDGDAHDRRPLAFERGGEIGDRAKRAVEHADVEATLLQVRRQIQQAERRMRAHDALLGGIEREEVAVGQQRSIGITTPAAAGARSRRSAFRRAGRTSRARIATATRFGAAIATRPASTRAGV